MREWFGSWGIQLSELHFACAVMGLGLVPESLRGRGSPRGMEQAVAEVLDESPQKLLHWSLDVLPTVKSGWAAALSADRLAEVVQPALSRQRRVALDTRSAIDGMTLWKFFRQHFWSASPQECWAFFLSQAAPGSTVRLRWPCRIGYFPGTLSESIAFDLKSRDSWEGNIFEISPLTRRRSECDLLIWQGTDLASSMEDLSSESAKIGGAETDLLAVFSMLDLPDSARVRTMEPLRRMVRATGLLWVPLFRVHPAAEVLRELFMGVSHNAELDAAVAAATRNEGFFLADERLIRRARLDRRLRTTARVMKRTERAHERIKFDASRAGWLGNLSDMLVRRDVGNLILDRLKKEDGYRWEGESHEASAYGHVSRRMREDDEERRVPRYLQTGLHAGDQVDHPTMGPLMLETAYKASVFIGERAPSYLSVEEPFPELEPLDDGRAHRLTVVFWEPHFSPEPQMQYIELPPVGNSSVCWFPFHTGSESASLTARITVLHRNRVLQSGILEARVGAPSAVPSFRVDAAPRQILNGLDERQNFSAAFLLNDMNDSGTVHAMTGDRAAVLSMDDATVKGLVQVLNAAITEITESPSKFEGLRAPGSESLLRTLAQKGASLREYLMRHAMRGGLFSAPTHVQVVSARPAKIFPVEFVYEFEAPEEEARLCAHAEKALEGEPLEGFCPDCTPAVLTDGQPTLVDREMVICPLAFWGLRCVIERKAHVPSDAEIGGDFQLVPEPVGAEDRLLYPLDSAVLGATDKASRYDPDAVKNMVERIRKLVPKVEMVHSWQDWVHTVKQNKPSLLALVVHQEKDSYGTPMLDIGLPPQLKSDLVKAKHVRPDEDRANPIALLIGCETALADIDYENFALRFQWRGAALVVSTIAKILGRQAAPVAAELIEEMSRVTEPKPFAEVLRNFRRRMLLTGTPMVLAMTALGDADWDVVGIH